MAGGIDILVDRGTADGSDFGLPFDRFPVQPGKNSLPVVNSSITSAG